MVTAKKINPTTNSTKASSRLSRLLLDANYKHSHSARNKKPVEKVNFSRIEAEFQMEKLFMCMY